MSKTKHHGDSPSPTEYKRTLHDLRIELVKLQNQVIREDFRILVVLEGRDGAGKDGAIKRIIKNLSLLHARRARVVHGRRAALRTAPRALRDHFTKVLSGHQ
jgi:polyphosphate kinase 2 (PPK2 family)